MAEATEKVLTYEQAIAACIESGQHERRTERDPRCGHCPGLVYELEAKACDKQGKHVVYPTVWPPANPDGLAAAHISVPLACDRCGMWLIVYDRPIKGVKVVKPEPVKAA